MSTLATYKTKLTEKIAQASTAFHTTEARVSAINEALLNLNEGYDIPDNIKKASLVFAGGMADPPADYARMVKLFVTAEPQREFTYIPEDLFDNQTSTSSNDYWTEDFDIGSGTRKLFVVPISVTTFTIRYIRKNPVLSVDGDESGLPNIFDDVVAYWAAYILLRNESDFPKAAEFERKARDTTLMAIQFRRKRGGVKQNERLRSVYEKYPLLTKNKLI